MVAAHDPGRWDEVRRIQDNVRASSLYFWGQELELWRLACRARGRAPEALEPGELHALATGIALPLVLDLRPDHPKRISEAARWGVPGEPGWWNA